MLTKSGWSMGTTAALEELRSTIMVNGEPFVMIPGISVMLKWCAGSWGVEKQSVPLHKPPLVREVGRSGWMKFSALVLRAISHSAHTVDLEMKIAMPLKMQEWSV